MRYRIEKSKTYESGKYQLMEEYEREEWRCCGVYMRKKDAVEDLRKIAAFECGQHTSLINK